MKVTQYIVIHCIIILFRCEFALCRTSSRIIIRPQKVRTLQKNIYRMREKYKISENVIGIIENSIINVTDVRQEFSYDDENDFGPQNWFKLSSICGHGRRQSPIDLSFLDVKVGNIFEPVQIKGLNQIPSSIMASNNGHSFVIKFAYADDFQVHFTKGPLGKEVFFLDSIHWHWGHNDFSGSEHRINGKQFSAEGHVVLFNSAYNSFKEATGKPNGIAVMGILYKWSFFPTYNPFITLVRNVYGPTASYIETKKVFPLEDLIPSETIRVLSYEGSFSTPPCNEDVKWMVMLHPMIISFSDLTEFRKMTDTNGEKILQNNRPLQNLNDRTVIFQ